MIRPTTRTLFPTAMAAALVAALMTAAAAPAFAVSIKHTNRAEGDPEVSTAAPSASRAAPPADTSGPHYFDKFHQDSARG